MATNIFTFSKSTGPAISRLCRRGGGRLIGAMPPRSRLQFTLVLVLLVALCLFVPSVLYFAEVALRELRVIWWLLLVIGGLAWLLALGRRKK